MLLWPFISLFPWSMSSIDFYCAANAIFRKCWQKSIRRRYAAAIGWLVYFWIVTGATGMHLDKARLQYSWFLAKHVLKKLTKSANTDLVNECSIIYGTELLSEMITERFNFQETSISTTIMWKLHWSLVCKDVSTYHRFSLMTVRQNHHMQCSVNDNFASYGDIRISIPHET